MWNELIVTKFLKDIKIDKQKIKENIILENKRQSFNAAQAQVLFGENDKERSH